MKWIMRSLQWALMKADKTFLSFFPASVQSELLRLASLEYKREKKTTPCRSSIQLDPSWFNCKTTSKLSICEKRRKKKRECRLLSTSGIYWNHKITCGCNKSLFYTMCSHPGLLYFGVSWVSAPFKPIK